MPVEDIAERLAEAIRKGQEVRRSGTVILWLLIGDRGGSGWEGPDIERMALWVPEGAMIDIFSQGIARFIFDTPYRYRFEVALLDASRPPERVVRIVEVVE